jgi:glycosyltransferase involved in cell wall biosynthesis
MRRKDQLPLTVVIPAFNRAAMLPRAVASIAGQHSYCPREIVVVDDGSADDTAIIAGKLGVRVLRHEVNQGPGAARNTGFAAAHTPWLIQLDSDDEWLPHCLETLWPLRNGHVIVSGATVGGRDMPWYNGVGGQRPRIVRSPAELIFPDNFIAASAVLLRATCVRAVGGYRTDLRQAEDLELWLRMLEFGTGVATPVVVSCYHDHPDQATAGRASAHAGHARVMAMSADRAWWDPAYPVRWSAIPTWDAFRTSLREREPRDAALSLWRVLGHPQRARGLLEVLRHRRRTRQAGRRRSRG